MKYLTLCAIALVGCTPRYANGVEPKFGDHVRVVSGFYRGMEGEVRTPNCALYLGSGWRLFEKADCSQMEPIK